MKRLIALALVLVMAVSLAGCCCCLNLETCEECGETTFCDTYEMKYTGREFTLCDDCYEEYRSLFK